MPRKIAARLLATALVLSPVALIEAAAPAAAQASFSISFGYFRDELAPYGQWYHHPRWGDVWHPRVANFRPYYRGHWDYTNRYGWLWVSDDEWGDIPFHYGRWVYDPYDGWLWVPGYVWSPAWVVWRSGGGYTGWFPMPPDDRFLAGDEVYRTDWNNWDRGFGYADWYGPSFGPNWLLSFTVFVDDRHFADRDYIRYIPPRNEFPTIINRTQNVTNYVTVNNYIVNRSVDVGRIERAAGRRIQPVPEQQVIRSNTPIVAVNQGRQIQREERRQHGGDLSASPRARIAALPENGAQLRDRNAPDNAGNRIEERNRANQRDNRNQPRAESNAPSGQVVSPQEREQRGRNAQERTRAEGQATQAQERAQAERAQNERDRAQNERTQREQAQQRAQDSGSATASERRQATEQHTSQPAE
jgi:hypothetical protein